MLKARTETMQMSEEERRMYRDRIKEIGPYQIGDALPNRSNLVYIQLPPVNTQGERDLHLGRVESIRKDMAKAKSLRQQRERQEFEREARRNLKRYASLRKA